MQVQGVCCGSEAEILSPGNLGYPSKADLDLNFR
jgi:hypothetical protein